MESAENFFYFWKRSQRRQQLKTLGLEEFYYQYLAQLFEAYIYTFILVHNINDVLWDIGLYALSLLLALITFYLISKKNIMKHYKLILAATIAPLAELVAADIIVASNSLSKTTIRPFHASYILYSIYVFLPLFKIRYCCYLGVGATGLYLAAYGFFSYNTDEFLIINLVTEFIFLLSINLFGLFFRLLREISVIEIFFDRWDLIKETVMFKYETEQEKNLLLSIIPANTANHLVTDIMHKIRKIQESSHLELSLKNFQLKPEKLYITYYTDVSILYADVVNYTYLTTQLEVKPLVKILHELFVKFDEAAVVHQCLRIKFLGDCYYCVSGIPEKNEFHARNCVELGLKMIKIIGEVRARHELDIDMRIGVHSGNVYAGIIGSTKWQYDIWSKDVEIANALESTGVAGVHISKYTLSVLKKKYEYENGPESIKTNELLIKNGITTTYLIIPEKKDEVDFNDSEDSEEYLNTLYIVSLVQQYQKIREEARKELEKQVQNLRREGSGTGRVSKLLISGLPKVQLQLVPLFLIMRNFKEELKFWHQPDVLLKYSCLIALLTYFFMAIMAGLNNPTNPNFRFETLIAIGILIFWIIILWYEPIWNIMWQYNNSFDEIESVRNKYSEYIYNCYGKLIKSIFWRLIIYFSVMTSNVICSLSRMTECKDYLQAGNTKEERKEWQHKHKVCFNPMYLTEVVSMARCVNFLFVQIPFVIKCTCDGIIINVYIWMIFFQYDSVFQDSATSNFGLDTKYSHLYALLIQFFLLNLMQRQTELFFKMDYTWKKRLEKKRKDTEISKLTAKVLIENILPVHVAEIYIGKKMKDELYTEKYDNVAIMFATIKNYEIGMVGLRVLNKIFCDFDEKLTMYSGKLKVEKIKVVGLTYMAACGLNPGFSEERKITSRRRLGPSKFTKLHESKSDSNEVLPDFSAQHPFLNVFMMAEFALELMKTLNKFNIEYVNTTGDEMTKAGVLSIGISHGEVMGGVVGSSKPFYDVWGNTINMASRMDSTGEDGKIQVTKETAHVLESFNIQCDYRGLTYVKGRNYIPTYFVGINEEYEFIPRLVHFPIIKIKTRQNEEDL